MAHKRVSQLTELTAAEVASGDLFYVIDVSAREGKKLTADQLGTYLNASGSFTVVQADTASYVLGANVHGTVVSASFAGASVASISASWASASLSSSYAITASFAMNSTVGSTTSASWASASLSASWAGRAGVALSSLTAAALVYPNTSTASFAIKAQLADTASYVNVSVTSASYANRSGFAATSDLADVALEMVYPNISTASYAITAENFVYNHYIDYGIFLSTTQSISASQLDWVEVSSSTGQARQTNVRAIGTVIVPYTSSVAVNETLTLKIKSRDTGDETTLDATPIYYDVSRTLNAFGTLLSGSLKVPFSLEGSASMLGEYTAFVTGSSWRIPIEPTRTTRFNLSSLSDTINVSIYEPPLFQVSPEQAVPITFYTGSHEGPFTNYRNEMLATGSALIDDVSVRNQGVTSIRYVWSLQNLTILDCGRNSLITSLKGMPDTLVTLSCDSCSIESMSPLDNATGMTYLHCGQNSLTSLPTLPISLSFLNCGDNLLTSISGLPETMSYLNAEDNLIATIPSDIPYGTTDLYLGTNQLPSFFPILPESLLTMSIFNNPIVTIGSTFPAALGWIDSYDISSLSTFPTLPASLLYLNVTSCSLTQGTMDTICSNAVAGGLTNGTILLNGNGPIMISTVNDFILTLQGLGWTVGYDSAV
jgi:hypothetical protein